MFRHMLALLVALAFNSATAAAQTPQDPEWTLLWPEGAPGALGNEDRDRPALRIYLPAQGPVPRSAVVVCPGGGYGNLALDHEGKQIASWLNARGVAAFVLRYRLGPRYRHPSPLLDVQRAIRYVRHNAASLGIASDRVGVWGFSAGGHLASTAGTHFDKGSPDAPDPVDRPGSRPDFLILAYPVITFTEEAYVHKGSRSNLLGPNADAALAGLLSNERQVTPETPPTFLFHTTEDTGVPPENSISFFLALHKAGVPAEMHIYQRGRHGVGLASSDPTLATWADRLADWLKARGVTN